MRHAGWLALLVISGALVSGPGSASAADPPQAVSIHPGHSTVALNGPWRFAVGDDLRWAAPDFDDTRWETVDLTPPPGAHDADVGLPGYVPGWSLRGHPGYMGYAWYRLRVTVESDKDAPLALAGPTDVDTTYQLYVDGKLLGGPGVFSGQTPTVYSVQPTVFPLQASQSTGPRTYQIALRVWMDPSDAGEDSGGIHIAPTIGHADDVDLLHQVQWLQTFKGYVVDAVEPMAFVLLAIMVFGLMACRSADSYSWLAAALLLTAWLRANQVLYFWTHAETLRGYDISTNVVLAPLVLAAWTMAWRDWFRVDNHPWLPRVIWALAMVYGVVALIGRPWFMLDAQHGLKAIADSLVQVVRVIFAALYLWVVGASAIRRPTPSIGLAAIAAITIGIGLFARELSSIGVPGIWFPYGTGVSRTQYAYAVLIPLLFALLQMRFVGYARPSS